MSESKESLDGILDRAKSCIELNELLNWCCSNPSFINLFQSPRSPSERLQLNRFIWKLSPSERLDSLLGAPSVVLSDPTNFSNSLLQSLVYFRSPRSNYHMFLAVSQILFGLFQSDLAKFAFQSHKSDLIA